MHCNWMQNTSSVENGHGSMSQIEWRIHCNWMQNTSSIENGHGCMSQIEWRMHCNWMQNTSTVENGHGCMSQIEGVWNGIGLQTPPPWRMEMAECLKMRGVCIGSGSRREQRW